MVRLFVIAFTLCSLNLISKEDEQAKTDSVYQFKIEKILVHTPVKNQSQTGTCWSFSAQSFLESELIKSGKPEIDLSEMFIVRNIYPEKAKNYVRMHGSANFGEGALSHDVINAMDKYGLVPESVYPGEMRIEDLHNHSEMVGVLTAMLDQVIRNRAGRLSDKWEEALNAVLDIYLGKNPTEFNYEGKSYTPKSFAQYLGLKKEDYVEFTSFTHHPFYSKFVLEVPDNFSRGYVHNVKMQELADIAFAAIDKGYTLIWGADVSEPGFSGKNGVAIYPEEQFELKKRKKEIKFDTLYKEVTPSQERRQKEFDNYLTQDDHGMHIIGTAKDVNGNAYFIVKNSWGTENMGYDGKLYVSVPYFLQKTTSIMLNKSGVPSDILKKCGL